MEALSDAPSRKVAPLHESVILILGTAALGVGFFALLQADWFIDFIALVVDLCCLIGAVYVGRGAYRIFGDYFPRRVRLTFAIVVGFSVGMCLMSMTHSHKLVRHLQAIGQSNDDDD